MDARHLGGLVRIAALAVVAVLAARDAHAQAPSGSTLSPDARSFLVNKDLGNERWTINVNLFGSSPADIINVTGNIFRADGGPASFVTCLVRNDSTGTLTSLTPTISDEGLVVDRFLSVTGNVYQPDGSPPSFVYCTQRADSTGTLSDPTSEFRFSCSGASACASNASECAETGWSLISDDIPLQASFFLPVGGLPATPASDPEIVIIGRTSDPPSIVVPIDASSLTAPDAAGPAGTCNTGAECILPILGSCLDVTGSVVELESGGSGCAVQDPDPSCIGCGGGATGQCGGDCAFPVAGATARGTCLPFDYESEECACYAIEAGGEQTVQGCGSVIGVSCPDAGCCANDPRGSCDPLGGLVDCPGVCVAGGAGCSSGG